MDDTTDIIKGTEILEYGTLYGVAAQTHDL